MHTMAGARGGRCVSTEYTHSLQRLTFECASGHRWETLYASIVKGCWCPHCAHRVPLTLGHAQEEAAKRGGLCLSTTYINDRTHLLWQCAEGHRWEARLDNVQFGKWCPHCGGSYPLNLQMMVEWAAKNGGKCLSAAYKNMRTHLEWECAKGHTWRAAPTNVLYQNTWCPQCRDSGGETLCREWLERHYGARFPKVRPPWLLHASVHGRRLELDGYNEALGIAFEYQGGQHYTFTRLYHKTLARFEEMRKNDANKAAMCAALGIRLIVIPYNVNIERFLEEQVKGLDAGQAA